MNTQPEQRLENMGQINFLIILSDDYLNYWKGGKKQGLKPLLKLQFFDFFDKQRSADIGLFFEGNGRLGRLWQYLILHQWNKSFSLIPVESMVRNHQQDYYKALQQSGTDGNSTAFLLFMCKIIRQSILEVKLSSDQVSDQASDQVNNLLLVANNSWMSAAELMEVLSLSHKPTFRKNYLNPALSLKLIEMRFPDSPRSPKQKYRKI